MLNQCALGQLQQEKEPSPCPEAVSSGGKTTEAGLCLLWKPIGLASGCNTQPHKAMIGVRQIVSRKLPKRLNTAVHIINFNYF